MIPLVFPLKIALARLFLPQIADERRTESRDAATV